MGNKREAAATLAFLNRHLLPSSGYANGGTLFASRKAEKEIWKGRIKHAATCARRLYE